jgi:hypothetical protein
MSPTGAVSVVQGGMQAFAITFKPSSLLSLTVDGQPMGGRSSFTFADLEGNHTIAASLAFTIKASAGVGGSISPLGVTVVNYGGSQTYTMTPTANYAVLLVLVDGVNVGAVFHYTFSNVTTNHSILAAFAYPPATPPTMAVSGDGSGGLNITWPDNYSGQLLWSPTLGPGAVWSPVGEAPGHVTGFFKFTVAPGSGTAFYGLSR